VEALQEQVPAAIAAEVAVVVDMAAVLAVAPDAAAD
jgi:hypothetical protein